MPTSGSRTSSLPAMRPYEPCLFDNVISVLVQELVASRLSADGPRQRVDPEIGVVASVARWRDRMRPCHSQASCTRRPPRGTPSAAGHAYRVRRGKPCGNWAGRSASAPQRSRSRAPRGSRGRCCRSLPRSGARYTRRCRLRGRIGRGSQSAPASTCGLHGPLVTMMCRPAHWALET